MVVFRLYRKLCRGSFRTGYESTRRSFRCRREEGAGGEAEVLFGGLAGAAEGAGGAGSGRLPPPAQASLAAKAAPRSMNQP